MVAYLIPFQIKFSVSIFLPWYSATSQNVLDFQLNSSKCIFFSSNTGIVQVAVEVRSTHVTRYFWRELDEDRMFQYSAGWKESCSLGAVHILRKALGGRGGGVCVFLTALYRKHGMVRLGSIPYEGEGGDQEVGNFV